MKVILTSWNNEQSCSGEIVAYRNVYTNKIIGKKQYNEMVEREIRNAWHELNDDEKAGYKNFKHFRKDMLENPDHDFEPLAMVIID